MPKERDSSGVKNDGWIQRDARWELAPLADAVSCVTLQHKVRAGLANWIHKPYRELGQTQGARRLLEKAIRINQTHHGPDHPTLGIWYFNLGRALWNLDEEENALELLKQAFFLFLDVLGVEHPHTITAWSYLQTYDPDWVREVSSNIDSAN